MRKALLKISGLLSLFLATLLAACASTRVALPPSIVRVPEIRYLPIPAADLEPCMVPVGKPIVNSDLLLHDQAAMQDLKNCNKQLARARAKNGAPSIPIPHPE